jgi:NhaA family Na+:H+ antiporter
MAVFFFAASLEIKRELISGQLNTFRKALMPAISATGGMLLPALIYLGWCHHPANYRGWGIPMATDIAFSLAILSLLGNRVPASLRIFLVAIAIIDDIGSILAIAFFYSSHLYGEYLAMAAAVVIILLIINYFKTARLFVYTIAGVLLWYFIFNSGIHATIAGVILAFLIPRSLIPRLEHMLHAPVSFVILPLFVLANTAIIIPADFYHIIASNVHLGVFTGLLIGKPVGIFIATWTADKLGIALLPDEIRARQILGVGFIAGIGFTVSLFTTSLAFSDIQMQLQAKVAILNASVLAGVIGYAYLYFRKKRQKKIV